jgi:hypothetical protein
VIFTLTELAGPIFVMAENESRKCSQLSNYFFFLFLFQVRLLIKFRTGHEGIINIAVAVVVVVVAAVVVVVNRKEEDEKYDSSVDYVVRTLSPCRVQYCILRLDF